MAGKESIIVNQEQLIEQLSRFLGGISVEGVAATGSINETIILRGENGKKFVLQRDDLFRGDKTLLAEQRFLDYLRSRGFPGVGAIKLGSLPFFKIDDKVYLVYPFIEGVGLDVSNPFHREQAYRAIGKFLSLSNHYDPEIGIWQNRWWNVTTYPFEENFREYIENSADAELVVEIYRTSRDRLFSQLIMPARKGSYKAGIIHSDFRPEHFIFKDEVLEGVIDWTSSHHDVFVMEFARPFLCLCRSYEQRAALMEAVGEHIKFSQEEEIAAFCSPLLLELTEFVWIVRHKAGFGGEEFKRELDNAVGRVSAAYEIYREVS